MELEEFRAQHGEFFMLQRGTVEQDDRPKWERFSTVAIDLETIREAAAGPASDHLIFAVPDKGIAPFPDWVTIGRANTNLIVVDHTSISKLHAFFVREGEAHHLYDGRSLNGTGINEAEAPRYGGSSKAVVNSGDRLRFGSTYFLFLDASALWSLLRD